MRSIHATTLIVALLLVLAPAALCTTTWYVDGVNGRDSNNCTSPITACKTISRAIALAASGDTIKVAAATYFEHLLINNRRLNILGSSASTTFIDGGGTMAVVNITNTGHVSLSGVTIQHGAPGIFNSGSVTVIRSAVVRNTASSGPNSFGGGIWNFNILRISNSTVAHNRATCNSCVAAWGGGIDNRGIATISNSTVSRNKASAGCTTGEFGCLAEGGGIYNLGKLTISSSTISGNMVSLPKCISRCGVGGGGVFTVEATTTIQNSIIANNSQGNCEGVMTSNGYNLSGDYTCTFASTGDLNNTNPILGPLKDNGGPTQTMALPAGSPAIDAGNPSGCTDGHGHLLKTDQRGNPRPNPEDAGGCDIGAYESQQD